MQFTTILGSLLVATTAVSAQNNTAATSGPQFNLACYPTLPGGGYTYNSSHPFPTPSNQRNGTPISTTQAPASTSLPIQSSNGTYLASTNLTVTSSSTQRSSVTGTSVITGASGASATASSGQAGASATSTAPLQQANAGAGLEIGAEGFLAMGVAALIFAAAL
ncbi:hypothetical protein LTR97_008765 [Elasticomyces elasticus]|uniref:Uncharacterized protein n=1 Tax=Elasticomyces elasticus TaxID=574655 RepID=A0AAN7W6Y1_9PEZI|nr:hypothetical protein LTR97_008765 [Elasticomyces elasticus]